MNVYKIWIQVHLVSVIDLVSTYVHRGKLGSHMQPAKVSVRLRTYLSFILFHGSDDHLCIFDISPDTTFRFMFDRAWFHFEP